MTARPARIEIRRSLQSKYHAWIAWLFVVIALSVALGVVYLNRENASLSTDSRLLGRIDHLPRGDSQTAESMSHPANDFANIRVVLWSQKSSSLRIESVTAPSSAGIFAFLIRTVEDDLGLWVHADRNGNARFDAGEPSWISMVTDQVFEQPRGSQNILPVKLKPVSEPSTLMKSVDAMVSTHRSGPTTASAFPIIFGELASLDDERLASSTGSTGLWLPAVAIRKSGLGVYFLEEFDPTRQPIVLVHGAGGSPQDFQSLIEVVDRSRWQIWIYVYPSGVRLDAAASALARILEGLEQRYANEPIALVAHSMGGLVAHASLLHLQATATQSTVARLVTIATPWQGHPAAWYGVHHAPVVLPSWRDMLPQSAFLKRLESAELEIPHLLIYGEKSRRKFYLPRRNDGTIGVDSATYRVIADRAVAVERFELGHAEIVRSPSVGRRVMEFLSNNQ